jgi:hypothetical protein
LRIRNARVELLAQRPGRWTLQSSSGEMREVVVDSVPTAVSIAGDWRVNFPSSSRTPVVFSELLSWPAHSDPAIRYFSGTATYTKNFTLEPIANYQLLLDLGTVHDLVEITLNKTDLGVLWKPPFIVDITRAVRAGNNQLELAVTNTWRNRLMGDHDKAENERTTFVVPMLRKGKPWLPGEPGDELAPAGILGPAQIRILRIVALT